MITSPHHVVAMTLSHVWMGVCVGWTIVNPGYPSPAFQTPSSLTLGKNTEISSTDKSCWRRLFFFYVEVTKSNPVPTSRKENWVFFPIPSGSWLPILQGWDVGPNADMIQAGTRASSKFLNSKTIPDPIWEDPAKLCYLEMAF